MADVQMNDGVQVTLDATGAATATIGPTHDAYWTVDTIILMTDRPGAAPVPRAVVYLDQVGPKGLQGITYDGSFDSASCDLALARGQQIIVMWSGGQAGDLATLSVTGRKGA